MAVCFSGSSDILGVTSLINIVLGNIVYPTAGNTYPLACASCKTWLYIHKSFVAIAEPENFTI